VDSALGKLPGVAAAHTSTPEHLALTVGNDDAHVGSESLFIDDTFPARTGQSLAPVANN
jgi:hypothetical protein